MYWFVSEVIDIVRIRPRKQGVTSIFVSVAG